MWATYEISLGYNHALRACPFAGCGKLFIRYFFQSREDGKTMLRQISEHRSITECTSTPVNRVPPESLPHLPTNMKISPMNLTFSP